MDRSTVYEMIDGEREYQQAINQPDEREIRKWLNSMKYYIGRAYDGHYDTSIDILAEVRKAVSVGVACLEQHGCPPRE